MKFDYLFTIVFSFIEIILILAIKGFSYPLLPLFLLLIAFNYISIEDWKTGFISLNLNIGICVLAVITAIMSRADIAVIGMNLLCFVLPFILLDFVFQKFVNKEKDEDRFLIGGGDIILFATISFLLSFANMMVMLFVASLISIIVSKFIGKSRVHFAPMILVGFLVAFLWGEVLLSGLLGLIMNAIYG
ncbi:MAG: prepilin peptidase [Clostridia bacterium]|nr:prepilin peptidase [Clostridia bacterium]